MKLPVMRCVWRLAAAVSLVLGLTACAHHLTQQECMTTNWKQMGYNDGSAGKGQRDFKGYQADCGKFHINLSTQTYHAGWLNGVKDYCTPSVELGLTQGRQGVSANALYGARGMFCQSSGSPLRLGAYQKGYRKGLRSYCMYDNGYNIGVAGKQPNDVCPSAWRGRFMSGWNAGGKQYCSNTGNAYAMGKAGAAYPSLCNASIYAAFRAQYDRGRVIHDRVKDLNSQVESVNTRIKSLVWDHDLQKIDDRTYVLGRKKDQASVDALSQVRLLVQERDNLKTQLFDAASKA